MGDKSGERRKDYLLLGQMAADIKTVKEDVKSIDNKVDKHSEDLAALKVKAAGWGFASGSVGAILLYIKMKLAVG